MSKTKKKGKKRQHHALRAVVIVLLILFVAAAFWFSRGLEESKGRFFANTTVNGVDYSGLDAEEAEAKFESTYAGKTMTVKEMGGAEETISFDAIDYHFTTGDTFTQLIDGQDYWRWFLAPYEMHELTTDEGFAYDEEKLRAEVHALSAVSGDQVIAPSDAHIENTGNGYEIIEAVDGDTLDEEKTYEAIKAAVDSGASEVDLEAEGCYLKAAVHSDDEALQARMAWIDTYQEMVITVALEGNTYEELAKDTFINWFTFGDDNETVTIDEDAVKAYTQSLADTYNTFMTERQFVTTKGDTLTVGGGNYDNYGYLMNVDASAGQILSALQSRVTQTIALTWDKYALARDENGSDFGDTYVEISLDEQHMWFYKDGKLVTDTDVVTGTATKERATPTGVMQILDKKQDHKMKGSYGTANAKYVMWLTNGGICIHDSSWRDEYGGDIYLTDGSHGCVNTPLDEVKIIYENISIGTPVIVYDRDNRVPDVENATYTTGGSSEEGVETLEETSENADASELEGDDD